MQMTNRLTLHCDSCGRIELVDEIEKVVTEENAQGDEWFIDGTIVNKSFDISDVLCPDCYEQERG